MADTFTVKINGTPRQVRRGVTVAAALVEAGEASRVSVSGQLRSPLCGMGICFECRVTVNGTAHVRGCQLLCEPGMEIRSHG